MTPIPISDAQRIAEDYGYHQVVIVARAVGEDGGEHVTTYGAGPEHCAVAAHIGQYLRTEIMSWPVQPHESVASEIARERERQMQIEGWTSEHDDQWSNGALARAAGCYALHAGAAKPAQVADGYAPQDWPWEARWWKPKSRRRDLIRAAALIVAEIERLDRAAAREAS